MTVFPTRAGQKITTFPGPIGTRGDERALESLRREIGLLGQAREHWSRQAATVRRRAGPNEGESDSAAHIAVEKRLGRAVFHAASLSPTSARGLLLQSDILLTLCSMRRDEEPDEGLAALTTAHMVALDAHLSRILSDAAVIEAANDRSADLHLVALSRQACSLMRAGAGDAAAEEQAYLDAQRPLDEVLDELALAAPITVAGITALAAVLLCGLEFCESFETRPWFTPVLFNVLSATSQLLDNMEPVVLAPAAGYHDSPVRIAPA